MITVGDISPYQKKTFKNNHLKYYDRLAKQKGK